MKFIRAPLAVYLCLLPLLLYLGVWQLNRADEKRQLLKLQAQQATTDVLTITANTAEGLDKLLYQPVKAVGRYDGKHQYLLDNKVNKGRAGYFVLTPFRFKNANKAVLVNRGWLPVGQNRLQLPGIHVDELETVISGRVNRFPTVGIKLPGAETPTVSWPAIVQVIDSKVLSQQLDCALLDFQIELDKQADNGFTREWLEPTTMTPEKHIGYAVQWFLLAITLTALFAKYGISKKHD